MHKYSLSQKTASEGLGTAILLATVIGSGIMGDRLAGGNVAIALLGNTIPTGAILFVLITMLGPISGAHFNPAVTLVALLRQDLSRSTAATFVAAQVFGAIVGVGIAHAMFDLPLLQASTKTRAGLAQGISEWVATFGLATTILLTLRAKPDAIATSVGLYITAAYWFTASTSFANPAVTLARAFSNTFAGIRLVDVPLFVAAQIIGALCAVSTAWLLTAHQTETVRTNAAATPAE